jgi:hypothetical protein
VKWLFFFLIYIYANRFAGLGTHFVPSSRIQQLEQHMSQQTDFSHENINKIIQEYSVDDSHTPEHYTLHKENRAIIDRCVVIICNKEGFIFIIRNGVL